MKRPWGAAARAAGVTSLLFIVLYNACNYLTRLRPDVGVWAFEWERHWPLVPALIVPYWSIDLLFVGAPFLCATREEVDLLQRRIVFVIIGGALGFLLIPLRFAFPRPEVEGVFAPWFATLYGFDAPHNLFPSLHIALRTVLAEFYVRKCLGPTRWFAHAWFSLVGLSTLLTWQHHLVDVAGGFWLAAIGLHLFPRAAAPLSPPANRTVALLYGLGAIVCTQLARLSWPATFLFVWPAFALGAAACGYAGHGTVYRKAQGRLSWATCVLFGPLLAGQWLSWWWYRRQSRRWDAVTPRVWIGRLLTEREAQAAVDAGVTAVLDLTVEFPEPLPFRASRYLNIPVLDLTAPTVAQLDEAVAFIQRESADGVVFIHCKAGYSRTAAAAAAWMVASGEVTDAAAAFQRLRTLRPRMVIRPEIHVALAARGTAGPPESAIPAGAKSNV